MSNEEKAALSNSMVQCAESMLMSHTTEHMLLWGSVDGNFYFSSTNRTWAIGALTRAKIMLEERERLDQGETDAS